MNFHFAEHLILRTPVFSRDDYNSDPDELLSLPLFQAAIYLASPGFYQRLASAGFKSGALNLREKNTLQKYLNRACFRPTPFGLFAGVSLVSWQKNSRIVIGPELSAIAEPDQEVVQQSYVLTAGEFNRDYSYLTNPSLYRVLNEYRFIRTEIGQGERQYQLQSTQYSQVLKKFLRFCRQSRTGTAIMDQLVKLAGCGPEEAADYAAFLTDTQILLPEFRPGITGEIRAPRQVIGQSLLRPQHFIRQAALLQKTAGPFAVRDEHTSYVILQRNLAEEGLAPDWQSHIRGGIFALDSLCPPDELPAMSQFRQAFLQQFEGQRISLLAALDPESGIGYQDPVSDPVNPLLETLHIFPRTTNNGPGWTSAHGYLLECWIMAERGHDPVIRLDTAGLNKIRKDDASDQLLGLSLLFRTADDRVWLESAGGNNALALAGRFTVGNEAIKIAAKNIAACLEAQNPDVLFAEILQLSDPHTDNVNRRESLWSFELPVTASSSLPAHQQLTLADLYLEMHNGLVYLWSEKHQKYVIPRLTTAYNHRINKLPLFRFLADLSYQYGRCNLGFDLRSYFPGLQHYPRVEYQKAILSPASWTLSADTLRSIQEAADEFIFPAFQELINTCGLPSVFSITEGDQHLVFYATRERDAVFFAGFIRQKKEITIIEYFELDASIASDMDGKPFIAQFNAMLLPDEPLAIPKRIAPIQEKLRTDRKYMPGSEWLYLKIYVPPTSASKLLLRIRPLLRRKYANGRISKWFFIRYEDHAPHIRLRLKIDPLDIGDVLTAFRRSLEGHVRQQVIREYQVDVYSRELERYQGAGISLTEDHFEASSDFVLQYLREGKSAPPAYLVAIITVQAITEILIPDLDRQQTFYREGYEGMLPEFDGSAMRRELDQKYRELSKEIYTALHRPNAIDSKSLTAVFNRLKQSINPMIVSLSANAIHLPDYLRSLIHMHLNRLFTDQQRKQEMVIYFLLYKHALSEARRRKNQAT